MKMKSVVKLLEAQGFETYVYESAYKKDGYTSCTKFYEEYAISVVAYNDGGFSINKWDVEIWDGKKRFKGTKTVDNKYFEKQSELKAELQNTIEEWGK